MAKPSLLDAMRSTAKGQAAPSASSAAVAEPPTARPENPYFRPGRAGKANVTGYFPPNVKKQLKVLAADQERTIQRLLAEALNDLFAKYGKPEIAPLEDV